MNKETSEKWWDVFWQLCINITQASYRQDSRDSVSNKLQTLANHVSIGFELSDKDKVDKKPEEEDN